MRRHMNFVNFLTKIMGQTLHKIPIWRFCIYSLERLILHPQYHHTSFLELFLTMKEDWPISYFWRKSSVDPFTGNPLWRLCKNDVLQRIVFMPFSCISPNIISKPILSKNEEWENFQFFFFFLPWQLCKNDMFMAWRELYRTARAKSVKLSLMWIVYSIE